MDGRMGEEEGESLDGRFGRRAYSIGRWHMDQ